MGQVIVRVFDMDVATLYSKYRDAEEEAFMSLIPPGKRRADPPAVKAKAEAKNGMVHFVYTGLDGKTLCMLTIRSPYYQADAQSIIVQLYWEEEAADFASGFLDWLHGNFHTDKREEDLAERRALQPGKPGNPGRESHTRARERLRSGESESTVRADWRTDYENETGVKPEDTTSGETELWRNVKRRAVTIAEE